MTKKLTKHGNSLALIIDKPILKLLKISENTSLELIVQDNQLIIRPKKRSSTRSKKDLQKIAEEIMDEYAEAFKKLAE